VYLDFLDQLEGMAYLALEDCLGFLDPKVTLERMESKGKWVLLGLRDTKVPKETLGLKEDLDQEVREERWAQLDQLGKKVHLE